MSVDYIDQSNGGWMTRDYSMDQADLAKMNVTGYKTQRNGSRTPIVNGDNFMSQDGGYDNYAANGSQRDQSGQYQPPGNMPPQQYSGQAATRGNAGYQMPGVVGNASGRPMQQAPAYNPGIGGGVQINPIPGASVVTGPQQAPATELDRAQLQNNNQELNRLATWGRAPVTGVTDSGALAQAQRTRAAWIPGGTSLLQQFSPDGAPLQVGGNGDVSNPMLTGSEKKQISDNRLNMDLINDPRFKTLMNNNPENGKRFYTAITGRDLEGDTQAQLAQITAQRAAQDKIATDVAKDTVIAPKDDTTGAGMYKQGDFVKRVVLPDPLNPGMMKVGYVPLSPVEAQSQGINLKGDITGNSDAHRATGYYSPTDIQALRTEQSRLRASKNAVDQKSTDDARAENYSTAALAVPGAAGPNGRGLSKKFVPFDSPMYDTSAQSGLNRNLRSAFVDNSATDGWGRGITNANTSIGNNLLNRNDPYYRTNDAYMQAVDATELKYRRDDNSSY